MPKAKKTSRKSPAQPSFNYAALPTAQLVETLRSFANLRPSVDLLLSATADRLDEYREMVELGQALNAGKTVTTYVCDLRNLQTLTDDDIANAITDVLRSVRDGAQAVVLPHSQDARKAAQLGMQADAISIHRRQNAARHARLSGRDVAKALGAEPAGKASKRAAAHMPRSAAHSRTRKATR